MSICTRWGSDCELVREVQSVDEWWAKEPPEKRSRENRAKDQSQIDGGMIWVIRYLDDGTEGIAHLGFLKADKGWTEIIEAAKAIMGPERSRECGLS